jgi:hypothetical protein
MPVMLNGVDNNLLDRIVVVRPNRLEYRQQLNGKPLGAAYKVNGHWFHGWFEDREVLFDAWAFDQWPPDIGPARLDDATWGQVFARRARAEFRAAPDIAIEWHVPSHAVARGMRAVLISGGVSNIEVVVTPPQANLGTSK